MSDDFFDMPSSDPCPECDGDGVHHECFGNGCDECENSGDCPECEGTGEANPFE